MYRFFSCEPIPDSHSMSHSMIDSHSCVNVCSTQYAVRSTHKKHGKTIECIFVFEFRPIVVHVPTDRAQTPLDSRFFFVYITHFYLFFGGTNSQRLTCFIFILFECKSTRTLAKLPKCACPCQVCEYLWI